MKRIDRYILLKFLKNLSLSLVGFFIISVITQLFRVIKYILNDQFTPIDGFKFLMAQTPTVMVMLMPLAVLLSALITMRGMAMSLEIIALKTSGISFRRIIKYPVIAIMFLIAATFYFNDLVATKGERVKREMKFDKIYNVSPLEIRQNVYFKGKGNYIYYIKLIEKHNEIKEVLLVETNDEITEIKTIIAATKGLYDEKKGYWEFFDLHINDIAAGKTSYHKNYVVKDLQETPQDFFKDKLYIKETPMKILRETAIFLKSTGGDVTQILEAYYARISYPFSLICISLLGFAMGSRYVRGSSVVGIGIAIVFGYSYYVLDSVVDAVVVGGVVSPFIGTWIPNIVFLAIGIYAMKRAEY